MNYANLTYDDLEGLGLDLTSLISSVTGGVTQVQGALDAKSIAKRNAQVAAANAEIERQRTAAIVAGRPIPVEWGKIAMYGGAAVVLSVVAIKLLRASKRRR